MSKKLTRLLAVVFAIALLASACGGSDDAEEAVDTAPATDDSSSDDSSSDDSSSDDAPVADASSACPGYTEPTANPGSTYTIPEGSPIADLEQQWADTRAAIVADIKANGYGVEDCILNGPGGFTMDLSECPADWSNNAGVDGSSVTIGHTTAQSGSLAAYGNISVGMEAYWDYVNANGGVGPDGLQLTLLTKDDGYVATQTQELVAELLQTEDPFYITTLGSPNTFSVQGTLNENCVPQPLSMTGHQAWGDPENFPWTSGLQLSYATESLLWGSWIEANLEAPVTVAALVMDNDFGLAYEKGFEEFVEESSIIESVEFVRHDPAAATLTNEITTLAAANADVFISMTAGNPCLLATQEAGRAGIVDNAQALFQPSVCKGISAYMAPAGEAADDWLIFGGGWKDSTDPQYENDPYISFMNTEIEAAGLDPEVGLYATGYGQFGWAHTEILRIAAELDGGLTRTNFMIALRAFRSEHPGLLEGIAFGQNGAEDAYLVEGSDLSQFDYDAQSWVILDVSDLDGESPNCAWVAGEGC